MHKAKSCITGLWQVALESERLQTNIYYCELRQPVWHQQFSTIQTIQFSLQPTWCSHVIQSNRMKYCKLLFLIGHMLPGLARPDYIEGFIWEGHIQCIHNEEVCVFDVARFGQFGGTFDLNEDRSMVSEIRGDKEKNWSGRCLFKK